jgi:hypothetical protein
MDEEENIRCGDKRNGEWRNLIVLPSRLCCEYCLVVFCLGALQVAACDAGLQVLCKRSVILKKPVGCSRFTVTALTKHDRHNFFLYGEIERNRASDEVYPRIYTRK